MAIACFGWGPSNIFPGGEDQNDPFSSDLKTERFTYKEAEGDIRKLSEHLKND